MDDMPKITLTFTVSVSEETVEGLRGGVGRRHALSILDRAMPSGVEVKVSTPGTYTPQVYDLNHIACRLRELSDPLTRPKVWTREQLDEFEELVIQLLASVVALYVIHPELQQHSNPGGTEQ